MEYIDGSNLSKSIDAGLGAQLIMAVGFSLSSWWVRSNYYAGGMAMITAAVFLMSPCLSWYLLRR